ncbi:MAG: efflux RND transporter permease subunit [Acidobacteria bacterium]|nr:efflux RND transporter permease subunit [Acidobacteriota bacterium]
MFLSNLSIKRPVLTTAAMLALVVVGLSSVKGLGIDQYPKIDFPVVTVSVPYPGASPDAVEQDVVRKIEEGLNSLEKVREIFSTSQDSVGTVVAEFQLERDVDKALEDVRSRVGQIRKDLPDAIKEPIIQKMDPASIPVLSLVLKPDETHGGMDDRELTRIADEFLKRRLENIPGVGGVSLVGGASRRILVQVDPARLEAVGATLQGVMAALGQDTRAVPSGNLLQDTREIAVRVDAKARQVKDFERVVVGNQKGRPIELREVATVVDGVKERRTLARLDGHNAVALELQRQIGGNTVAMVQAVDKALAELDPELKKMGIRVLKAKDNSKFIHDAVEDVKVSILLGGALTVLIVFYFLKSWRSTVITSLTLPVSVISSFTIMKILDFTLNTMTLMGLSLAIGILIDDAIVVRENITRHAEMGKDHVTAAIEGTSEIGPAVLATTLSLLAVFVPVAFMGGIVGRFFYPFAITVAFAVAVSLLVSFTLDPMLSAVWPDPEHEKGYQESHHGHRHFVMKSVEWFNDRLDGWEKAYRRTITWALGHRKTVMGIGFGSFILAMGLMGLLGSDFMPDFDRGDMQLGFKTEPGASLEATRAKAEEIEKLLKKTKEVDLVFTTIGTGLTASVNEGRMYIKLKEGRRRNHVAIRRELRERLQGLPGVEAGVGPVADFGDEKPFNIAILSPDRRLAEQAEPQVKAMFQRITGAVDITSSRDLGKPEIRLTVDRKQASDLGVSPMAIANVVRPMVDGADVAKFENESGEQYDVTVRLSDEGRARAEQLSGMMVTSTKKDKAGNNLQVRLSNVARFEETVAPAKLQRRQLQAQVMLSANKEGKTLQEVVNELQKGLQELKAKGSLPEGVNVDFVGQARHNKETGQHMGSALLLAVAFIYLVLASQFESFKLPVTIMVSLPLSMVGMVLMLLVTGDPMSMMTSIGLILLMGLVTKNAILLVDRALQMMREEGIPRREAIIEAGMTRLRPILMTSFAMVGGMLPLFLALGAGAEMRAPMARAVVGGIVTSTLLTLVVIPVFFDMMDEFRFKDLWARIRGTRTGGSGEEIPRG